jgi:PKD domain
VQKFSADLSSLIFSTVFGSGITIPNISPTAFLVNECDNIFLSGWGGDINRLIGYWNSTTIGMPITPDAFQKTTSGSDFYFMVLNSNATELLYSTFLGGNNSKTHVDGGTSRFDKYGIVYHAVCAGCATLNDTGKATSDFPTTAGAVSRLNKSTNCNNAAFKFDFASLRARIETNNVALNSPGITRACFPDSMVFINNSTGGETYQWNFGDGHIITKSKTDKSPIIHPYNQEGVYRVTLKAIDDNTCIGVDSISKVINYFEDEIAVADDSEICFGSNIQLVASGGSSYQ